MEIAVNYQDAKEGGKSAEKLTVVDSVFGADFNEGLVHQVVNAYLAGMRQGTHKTLSRSEVYYANKKQWRQKGTGRARAGSKANPIWRGGGMAFARRPRDYSQKLPRKNLADRQAWA